VAGCQAGAQPPNTSNPARSTAREQEILIAMSLFTTVSGLVTTRYEGRQGNLETGAAYLLEFPLIFGYDRNRLYQ
jgi:hypothetical protein